MDKKEKANNPPDEITDPVDLPFESHSSDWVDWIYDHRRGLLVTVAVYLLLAVGIVTAKVTLSPPRSQEVYFFDPNQLEELAEEKERLEQQVREMQMLQQWEKDYYESIRNQASNAEGELNSGLRDAHNTQASGIYDEAQAVQDRMRAGRDAYEQGLRDAEAILNNRPAASSGDGESQMKDKQQGNVTVSYSLSGRHATYLPVPAYQCQGGGQITVDITVNRNGQVTGASVSAGSSSDPCLREYALKAAQASRFNVDQTADNRQSGTITYLFVPQ